MCGVAVIKYIPYKNHLSLEVKSESSSFLWALLKVLAKIRATKDGRKQGQQVNVKAQHNNGCKPSARLQT